jgi:hypothetical protein
MLSSIRDQSSVLKNSGLKNGIGELNRARLTIVAVDVVSVLVTVAASSIHQHQTLNNCFT